MKIRKRVNPLDTLTGEQRKAILELLALEPCHLTGEHNPCHTHLYACHYQKSDAWDRAVSALGGDPKNPPRQAHDCYWCENYPKPEIKAWLKGEPYPEQK